jgi:DNA-directed RNA polymerase specialized sigma24 family protein
MSAHGSVSHWITLLKAGDSAAAQELWECYFRRLVGLARRKLQDLPRRMADEEDVALSAFDSFCRGAAQGRFPQLLDRSDLWHLLVILTARKASKLKRYERQQKRGGRCAGVSVGHADPDTEKDGELEQLIGPEPTPAFAAQVAEECRRLLEQLADDTLRVVALRKMEGYTNEEIAAELDCGLRTVERKLWLIRGLWEKELAP